MCFPCADDEVPFHLPERAVWPVSYTHLDVYKRQIKTRGNNLYSSFDTAVVGLFEWVDGKNVETDQTKSTEYQMLCKIYPVSYTHLDVYKRQVLYNTVQRVSGGFRCAGIQADPRDKQYHTL